MINKIINTYNKPISISYFLQDKLLKVWLRKITKEIKVLGVIYWSATEAYGEYSQEEGQRILALAETNFNEAFEIVASWKKEKSLPE